jgi:hypothetical protein
VDQIIIGDVIKRERVVTIVAGIKEHFTFFFSQQSLVKALLEFERFSNIY